MTEVDQTRIREQKKQWDIFWRNKAEHNGFSRVLSLFRTRLFARSVAFFISKYFRAEGNYLEAGSGTSQTSVMIRRQQRNLYCLDFSGEALKEAQKIPVIQNGIQSDIFKIPFKDESIDGIWNLGVMEHFTDQEINAIFGEFHRVLKPGAYVLLFWPPLFGWYKAAAVLVEGVLSLIRMQRVQLYPDEINLYRNHHKVKNWCARHNFSFESGATSHLDLFTYVVVILRKG